ncbi:MAG TPA: beta-galactosidase, partial [Xanthobacteraceae bacterium]
DARSTVARLADFSGIYVATQPLHNVQRNLRDEVYQVDGVDGIYVRLVWRTIAPAPGRFDWSTLDRELDRVERTGKKLSIGVRAGAWTPGWLYEQGVRGSRFVVGAHGGGLGRCDEHTLPWPWDDRYQQAYIDMMRALAAHLKARPRSYELLRIVKITGINQRSEEMRMPANAVAGIKRAGGCAISDAVSEWRAAGYRPSKVVEAWRRMAEGVAASFPDKLLAIEVLDRNDFPAIAEPGRGELIDVKAQIVALGLGLFPGRFAVQWDGLSAVRAADSVIASGRRGAIVGWQTNLFRGPEGGAGCEARTVYEAQPCTASSFRAILENGIAHGGRYIEVWAPDALRFGDVLKDVRPRIGARAP